MKYNKIIFLAIFVLFSVQIRAQHRKIDFIENESLETVLQKAESAKKLTFVDCCSTWCPPCRTMEKLVFTLDSVADFFNGKFVNLKMNMTLPQNKKYSLKYQIESYPSYLILNSKGEVLYKFIGGMEADKFMKKIREGLNPENRYAEMNRIYQSGKYSDKFVREYICAKLDRNERSEAKALAEKYFQKLTSQQKISSENWFLFGENKYEKYLSGVKSTTFDYLLDHWADFVKTNGKQNVYSKIANTYRTITKWVLCGWYFKDFGRNEEDFFKYKKQLSPIPLPDKDQYLIMMDIAAAACRKDTIAAGNILADHIGEFTAENQQIMFDFFVLSPRHKKFPREEEMARKVIQSGKKSNLQKYLQTLYPDIKSVSSVEKYDVPNLKSRVGATSIIPFFHPKKPICWYRFEDSSHRAAYYSYDLQNGKHLLYDTLAIDSFLKVHSINDRSRISYSPEFRDQGIESRFSYGGKSYIYNPDSGTISIASERKYPTISWGISPNKRYEIKLRDNNLFVKRTDSDTLSQLSFDSTKNLEFQLADLTWIADSKFYITRKDQRNVRSLALLNYLRTFPEATTYKYELPGDTAVTHNQLYFCDLSGNGKLELVNTDKWKDQQLEVMQTKDVTDKIFFIRRKRTRDQLELCYIDIATKKVNIVFHEDSKPYINEDMFHCYVVNKGKDIFMWSDRTGWGHYYHYSINGKLLNAVTQGAWTAGKICRIDTLGKNIYCYGYGKEKGLNPNYSFLYKVDFSGKKVKLLTPENANHSVFISPALNLLVDNCSRIDTLPQSKVRDMNGRLLAVLEKPDISKLFNYGWKMPEQFTVKAADGKTDLYGIMWKPYNFDPNKKYPIISQVYPGPQIETVWTDFTVFDKYNNTALAQRGFIVVCMGHRGGSPLRNKEYAQYGYGNLRDYPLADDKAGLEQLAAKYSFIDISRVGILGHSGGGMMAVAAICTYPDFYKVAVASSGNHDNTIYNRTWGETYQGIGEDNKFSVKTNQQLVSGLKGHLLLVTGDADANVHPANTYRLVDALIQADKDFDLLILPGQSHHYEEPYQSYFEKKKRDFFSKYL